MLAGLSIIAAIGIAFGLVNGSADAGQDCGSCDPGVATYMLQNMQYVDKTDFDELVACSNQK